MRFELTGPWPLADLPETVWLAFAKGLGAVLGSAISLVYVLPKDRREAAIRFVVGVLVGVLFGPVAGVWLLDQLGLSEKIGPSEILMTGAAAASLCAWWALGLLRRVFENRQFGVNDTRKGG